MKRYASAVVVALVLLMAGVPGVAEAHRSGCHRWHSCPSDSGSYTCGDLGYSNYCGGSTTVQKVEEKTKPEPKEGRPFPGYVSAEDPNTYLVNYTQLQFVGEKGVEGSTASNPAQTSTMPAGVQMKAVELQKVDNPNGYSLGQNLFAYDFPSNTKSHQTRWIINEGSILRQTRIVGRFVNITGRRMTKAKVHLFRVNERGQEPEQLPETASVFPVILEPGDTGYYEIDGDGYMPHDALAVGIMEWSEGVVSGLHAMPITKRDYRVETDKWGTTRLQGYATVYNDLDHTVWTLYLIVVFKDKDGNVLKVEGPQRVYGWVDPGKSKDYFLYLFVLDRMDGFESVDVILYDGL